MLAKQRRDSEMSLENKPSCRTQNRYSDTQTFILNKLAKACLIAYLSLVLNQKTTTRKTSLCSPKHNLTTCPCYVPNVKFPAVLQYRKFNCEPITLRPTESYCNHCFEGMVVLTEDALLKEIGERQIIFDAWQVSGGKRKPEIDRKGVKHDDDIPAT